MKPAKKTKRKTGSRKKSPVRRTLIALGLILTFAFAGTVLYYYERIFSPNLSIESGESAWVYIPTGADFNDVLQELTRKKLIQNSETFVWMAEFSGYDKKVKSGRYRVKPGMNNRELVNLLKSGAQEPLRITLQAMRYPEEVAGKIGRLLEADSSEMMHKLTQTDFLAGFGLNRQSALAFFIPDTYTFYWDTPADSFLLFMAHRYREFWNQQRKRQAEQIGMSPAEVSILASIVQQESSKPEEWPIIAGVYLNRLRKGMKLQADPTVKFAAGKHDLRRVKGILQTDSPYNTYKVQGLPPGPIYMASGKCIDAVLHATSHGYFYFCASPDKPGYHSFAKTWPEHQINAQKYWRYLDARGIQ